MPKSVMTRWCQHLHMSEEAGLPDHNGRCQIYACCEDCDFSYPIRGAHTWVI